jgi:hypothetical protein
MTQIQLPPKFKSHPECAAGIITIEQAKFMIDKGWLSLEGARFLLPPQIWFMLPKSKPRNNQAKRSGWFWNWLQR